MVVGDETISINVSKETMKKYYHEYECNIRSVFGRIEVKVDSCYDLSESTEFIVDFINLLICLSIFSSIVKSSIPFKYLYMMLESI